jgi:hypothetical protein
MMRLGTLYGAPLMLDTEDETVFNDAQDLLAKMAAAALSVSSPTP